MAGYEIWKQLTARMAPTHTTGLPNWRWLEPDEKLRFKFAPGVQYWYSGELYAHAMRKKDSQLQSLRYAAHSLVGYAAGVPVGG